ncbi:VIT1/CCC1 transporter family protein [Brevibacterium luteolum]|uniref:Rubrerythrin family protein n=1 Tax=Brevibacterium luteolum TaxID=199591 RepID=A0A849APB1_9MICO|nr:VIT1/CCC1 transporter family protein [Brevibacterium luteolum]MBM7529897.1 VIT1/CCC1 family predicted Fe2+/Mn2+ transporter [Brevibacterium luteolum]NNG78649.1 rubrerythrin family protein [Brevibacterium luteolum]
MPDTRAAVPAEPSPALIRQWQRHLANERLEERVYRKLAARKQGEEREILLAIADAERRHQQHWIDLLGEHAEHRRAPDLSTRILSLLGSIFGSVFILALIQQQETSSPYDTDQYASDQMAADEKVHAEVVRALAAKSRARLSGNFRAAVFGANDGLVSNLALVLGVGAAGMSNPVILLTGISGLLAGALSMGAGEYISVRSQRELLEASQPVRQPAEALASLDFDANELALVYRARGYDEDEALAKAQRTLARAHGGTLPSHTAPTGKENEHEELGTGIGAAASSFCFFASGAIVPILPYIFGMHGMPAILTAAGLVGVALLGTGGTVGVLSGRPPLPRALRQLAIGFGAAAATYLLGLAFGTTLS